MVESVGNSTSLVPGSRASQLRPARLRGDVLTAVQQSETRASDSLKAVRVFAVPQASGPASTAPKLPRGSLIDVLA